MKFNSLVENDNYRVRVECKEKCGFVNLFSKVGGKYTYRIKRWDKDHTCVMVLYFYIVALQLLSGYLRQV